jgi:hypothetical protein
MKINPEVWENTIGFFLHTIAYYYPKTVVRHKTEILRLDPEHLFYPQPSDGRFFGVDKHIPRVPVFRQPTRLLGGFGSYTTK